MPLEEEKENIQQQVSQIEFVNRLNEIQFITNIYCPLYLLISAPVGYGKTRLLEAIEDNLQKQNWLCIRLELSKDESCSLEALTSQILGQLEEIQVRKDDDQHLDHGMLQDPTSADFKGNEQRLHQQITDLQRFWDLLRERLVRLKERYILETRTEEKFFLERLIAEATNESKQFEQQLQALESQLSHFQFKGARGITDRNDDQDLEQINVMTPEAAGHAIGRRILTVLNNTRKHVLILLDNAESVKDDLVKQLLNQCLLAVKDVLSIADRSIRLRLIFAGRHISSWKQLISKIPLESIFLTPFDFPAVFQTVENFAKTSRIGTAPDYKEDFAAHLMYFTGGHPGCMVDILRKHYGSPINEIVSYENEYYETLINPVIHDLQHTIPLELQEVFEKLSVFRIYNYPLLEKIIKGKVISYEGNVNSLEGELTSTYLVERKHGFIQSDLIRRLLVIKLRKEGGEKVFRELCGRARTICKEYFKETIYNPHSVALECLYQELQLAYYQSDQSPKARKLLHRRFFAKNGILQRYLRLLADKPDAHDILANFVKVLQDRDDWEFQFTLNFFLRKEHQYANEPYEFMLRKVNTFLLKD